jgi:hypothetical protein
MYSGRTWGIGVSEGGYRETDGAATFAKVGFGRGSASLANAKSTTVSNMTPPGTSCLICSRPICQKITQRSIAMLLFTICVLCTRNSTKSLINFAHAVVKRRVWPRSAIGQQACDQTALAAGSAGDQPHKLQVTISQTVH